jgi:transforming growth factor-beta-induced protein
MKRFILVIGMLVLSLVLVACAGATGTAVDSVSEPAASETEVPTEESIEEADEMSEEEAMDGKSIVDIAVEDGRFTTLVAAVEAAGLVDTLSGEGEFTVFAPTDDAFAALPEGTVESLLEDPEGALRDILLYHVAEGAVPAETVVTLDSATTVQGEPVAISVMDGNVRLNDSANVIITDIAASNGIIHVIDSVILPPSMAEAEAEEEMAEEETTDARSIAEIAIEDGRFTTLVAALEAAGLAETLSGEGEFTVFAPTDDAFAALPEGTVESLLEDPEGALNDVLLYHVVGSAVPAETVVTLDSADTMQGEPVSIAVVDGEVILNESAKVITPDIAASNGIIHVIDAVILPPSMTEAADDEEMTEEDMTNVSSIAEIAAEDGRFTTLVAAVEAAGLAETLSGEGEFTVFAPTDDAFAALPEGTVESLLEDPEGALKDILLYHVLSQAVPADEVVNYEAAETAQGENVSIAVVDGEVVLNDSARVVNPDIEASNGIIHVIDSVILPPSMTEEEAEEEMAEEEMMDAKSIAEVAVEDGRFTTLVAALDAAGLVDTLAGEGEFTVFAPTDEAFAALPEGTVETLLEDPQGDLTNILLYHVVEGVVPAETVVTLDSAPTLQGSDVHITVTDEGVFLNDTVKVIITDVVASNGIIHVIDGVLIPPAEQASNMQTVMQDKSYSSCGTGSNV